MSRHTGKMTLSAHIFSFSMHSSFERVEAFLPLDTIASLKNSDSVPADSNMKATLDTALRICSSRMPSCM